MQHTHAITFLIGCLYAALVHLTSRRHPRLPVTASFVVIGNSLVILYLWRNLGWQAARTALAANILLGIPQIVGYHARTLDELADLLEGVIDYGD